MKVPSMRIPAALITAVALAGCAANPEADPSAGLDLMKGIGATIDAADGSRSFRYVLPPEAGNNRAQHEALISQWAAYPDVCPRGYSIAKVEDVRGMTVYSGPCR